MEYFALILVDVGIKVQLSWTKDLSQKVLLVTDFPLKQDRSQLLHQLLGYNGEEFWQHDCYHLPEY